MYTIKFTSIDTDTVVEEREVDDRLEPMWMASGMDILDYNGSLIWEVELYIRQALRNLRAAPGYFTGQFEMVKGDYHEVEALMEWMLGIAEDEPDLEIGVIY